MNRTRLGIVSLAMVLLLGASAFWVGSSLPADLMLPTHWGLSGQPDRFSGKWAALLLPVGMTAGLSLLFWFLPALEPRARNFSRSGGLYLWSWAGLLMMMAATELVIIASALHWPFRVEHIMMGAVGLLFVMIGNQLGKSRSMYMVGIRTPWTLASEEVWIKTHRLGGKLMVLGGVVLAIAAFLPVPSGVFAAIFGTIIVVVAGVPTVYSYLLWRREKAQPSE